MLKDELAKIYQQRQDKQNLINEFHQAKNYTVISADKVDWLGDEIELYVTKISNNLLKISDFEITDYNYQCADTNDNYFATDKTIADDKYIRQYIYQNHVLLYKNELIIYSSFQHFPEKINLLINLVSDINAYLKNNLVNKR